MAMERSHRLANRLICRVDGQHASNGSQCVPVCTSLRMLRRIAVYFRIARVEEIHDEIFLHAGTMFVAARIATAAGS